MQKYIGGEVETLGTIEYAGRTNVAALVDGGWVVTWDYTTADWQGNPAKSYQQRFAADGTEVGDAVELLGVGHGVAALAGGGWASGYQTVDMGGTDVDTFVSLYDEDGQSVILDERSNSYTASWQSFGDVAGLADGGWIVTWYGYGDGHDQDSDNDQEIYQQRYDADGDLIAANQVVNTTFEGNQGASEVIGLADGGWVVMWVSAYNGFSGADIYQQRYDEDGDKVGQEERINDPGIQPGPSVFADRSSSITALVGGGWVVSWTAGSHAEEKLYQQRFDASGARVGAQTAIVLADGAAAPQVRALPNGGWVVTYIAIDDHESEMRAQVFAADGTLSGRSVTLEAAGEPSFTVLEDGRFVVTWTADQGSGNYEVRQQIFSTIENEGPVSLNDHLAITERSLKTFNVLANDVDADHGEELTLESATVTSGNATVTFAANGDIHIQDNSIQLVKGQKATIKIEYTVSDGLDRDTGILTVKVAGTTDEGDVMRGSNGADRLTGTEVGEVYFGRGGNDYIDGKGGDDFLLGDGGRDILKAGDGRDTLVGGKGDDKLFGGSGSDTFIFSPGDGRDVITQPSSWSSGERDVLDFTSYGFKNVDQVKRLIEVEGHVVTIDLPGKDRIEIIDTLGHGMYFTI